MKRVEMQVCGQGLIISSEWCSDDGRQIGSVRRADSDSGKCSRFKIEVETSRTWRVSHMVSSAQWVKISFVSSSL